MIKELHLQRQLAERRNVEFEEILQVQRREWEEKILQEQDIRIALEKQCSELQIWKTR